LLERVIDARLATKAGRSENLQDKDEVREQVMRFEDRLVGAAYLDKVIRAKVTDEAVRAKYDESVKSYEAEEEISARHILVKTKKEAEALIKQLDGGADFAKLAGEKSTGPSKSQGGDLGYFTHDRMVPPFADAAFALEEGGYTKTPVKTQFGWHVIKVEDKRKSAPPSFEEEQAKLQQEMSTEVARQVMDNLKKGASIERFAADGGPREAKPAAKSE